MNSTLSKPSKLRMLYAIAGVWFAFLCPSYSNIPREFDGAQDIILEILRNEIPQPQQNKKTNLNTLKTYDLMQPTDKVMKKITAEPEFSDYIRQRKESLSPEQVKMLDSKAQRLWMIEYVQSRENVKPEIKAWLYVMLVPDVPWDQALAAYHRLEKYRPKDFVPALMMAFKVQAPGLDPPTTQQWNDLIGILRQAVPHAKNAEDVIDCLSVIGAGALKLEKPGNNQELLQIWHWMRDVKLPESQQESHDALRLNFIKMYIAMAAKDYTAAAQIAPQCQMRFFQPIILVLADKRDEAYETLKRLRQDTTLTNKEQAGLRKFEPLILMFTHKFEEAWKAISEQQSSKMSAEDLKWRELMEQMLRDYETAVRSRGNKQP